MNIHNFPPLHVLKQLTRFILCKPVTEQSNHMKIAARFVSLDCVYASSQIWMCLIFQPQSSQVSIDISTDSRDGNDDQVTVL